MKRCLICVFFFAGATLAFAERPRTTADSRRLPLLGEIARLSEEGFSDETIVAYVTSRRAELPSVLAAEDLIWLRRRGVSEAVIRYLVSRTAIDVGSTGEVVYDESASDVYPVDGGYSTYPAYFYGGSYYPYSPYDGAGSFYYPYYYFSGHYFGGRHFGGRHFRRHHLGGGHFGGRHFRGHRAIRHGGRHRPGFGGHFGHRGFDGHFRRGGSAGHGHFGARAGHARIPRVGGRHSGSFGGRAGGGRPGFGHGGGRSGFGHGHAGGHGSGHSRH